MDTKQQTCAERIGANMADRAEYARALFEIIDTGSGPDPDGSRVRNAAGDWVDAGDMLDGDGALERLDDWPLAVGVRRLLRIELSTGGPADYLTAEIDDGEVVRVVYHYADWFDHAEQTIDQDSPLWRLAEHYAVYASEVE